jgi:hypothetical protein
MILKFRVNNGFIVQIHVRMLIARSLQTVRFALSNQIAVGVLKRILWKKHVFLVRRKIEIMIAICSIGHQVQINVQLLLRVNHIRIVQIVLGMLLSVVVGVNQANVVYLEIFPLQNVLNFKKIVVMRIVQILGIVSIVSMQRHVGGVQHRWVSNLFVHMEMPLVLLSLIQQRVTLGTLVLVQLAILIIARIVITMMIVRGVKFLQVKEIKVKDI